MWFMKNKGWTMVRSRKTSMLIYAIFPLMVVFSQYAGSFNMWYAVIIIGIGMSAHQAWSANIMTTVSDMFPKNSIGAVIGTTILPGPGTLIGGLVGGLLAGSAASTVSQTALDQLIKDEAKEILIIIEAELEILSFDYLLSEPELKSVVAQSETINWSIQLAECSSRSDRSIAVKNILETLVTMIVKQRQKITLPNEIQLLDGYEKFLGDMKF